ncbi:phage holin family protein [Demequina aurantiaca]|uniref:phage holin family protein n=1 Tax=Demequina aurantiaca TaxID=676200 RepID=UPI0007844C70|nr:phage holin family protein [Demequina aurantiaca]
MSDNNIGKAFVNSVVSAFFGNWISTIKTEIEIAKIELKYKAAELGKGIGMLVGAAVFGFFLLLLLLTAAVAGLSTALPVWASALIVAGLILVIVLILGIWGGYKVKKNKDIKPERAINNIKNSMPF